MKSAASLGKFFASIALCELAGTFGSLFTVPAIPTWYDYLVHPQYAPPDWLFGPVWVVLYFLMGVAVFLVWKDGFQKRRQELALFFSQLLVNVAWSVVFFGMQNLGAAFILIIALWVAILATLLAFESVSRKAAWLLVPYLLWVSYAVYLSYSFWILNPTA